MTSAAPSMTAPRCDLLRKKLARIELDENESPIDAEVAAH